MAIPPSSEIQCKSLEIIQEKEEPPDEPRVQELKVACLLLGLDYAALGD